jgi:hypothetical protein
MKEPKHTIHNNDSQMLLNPILKEACLKHKVPEVSQARIISDGVKQFSIYSDGSVMSTGFYKSVDQYVEQRRNDDQLESPLSKGTKDDLLVEMARYAITGNVSAYRNCRRKYSEST